MHWVAVSEGGQWRMCIGLQHLQGRLTALRSMKMGRGEL